MSEPIPTGSSGIPTEGSSAPDADLSIEAQQFSAPAAGGAEAVAEEALYTHSGTPCV